YNPSVPYTCCPRYPPSFPTRRSSDLEHHRLAADEQLAGHVVGRRSSGVVDDADLDALDRMTHGAGPTFALQRVRDREQGLRHAVALEDTVARAGLEPQERVARQRCAPGREQARPREL